MTRAKLTYDEYWVVDPETDVVRIYRREGGSFTRAEELAAERSDVLTTPLLPGLEIPFTALFAD